MYDTKPSEKIRDCNAKRLNNEEITYVFFFISFFNYQKVIDPKYYQLICQTLSCWYLVVVAIDKCRSVYSIVWYGTVWYDIYKYYDKIVCLSVIELSSAAFSQWQIVQKYCFITPPLCPCSFSAILDWMQIVKLICTNALVKTGTATRAIGIQL